MIIIIAILYLCFHNSTAVYLSREVAPEQEFCLAQDLPRHTLAKVDIQVHGEFVFDFKQGRMIAFRESLLDRSFSRSFTTQRYGIHFFCLTNKGKQEQRIKIQIAVGKQANDYGSSVDTDDLIGSLSNQGRVAQSFIQDIIKQNSEGLQIMVSESTEHYTFSNLYIFSTIFVLASMLLTSVQYRIIRKYLHVRKYI